MKKIMTKLFLTAAFGLFASFAAIAASGDIYDICLCDENGNTISAPVTDIVNPLGLTGMDGKGYIYFKVRLIVRQENDSRWEVVPKSWTPPADWEEIVDRLDSNYPLGAPQIGIYVSGRLYWATLIMDRHVGDFSTEFIFRYKVKRGDFALPIVLATKASDSASITETIPATSDSGGGVYVLNPARSNYSILSYATDPATSAVTTNSVSWRRCASPIAPDLLPRGTDTTLENCGFYVQTINFSDDAEDATFWRSVHENSPNTGNGASPKLEVSDNESPTDPVTLYVWSTDESAVYVNTDNIVNMRINKNGDIEPRHVGVLNVTSGTKPFSIFGASGGQGKMAQLVLSAYPGYSFSAVTEDLLLDYVTVPVKCIEPEPATIQITRDDPTVIAQTAGDDKYLAAVTRLTIESTLPPKADVHVTINTIFQVDPAKTNWWDYVRFSTDNTAETLPAAVAPVVTLTPTDYKKYIYVYALRAETAYTIGTGKQVQFFPEVDAAEMTAAEITDLKETGINIHANPPIITAPIGGDDPIYSVTAGEKLEIPVAVNDTYADMTDITTGYKVRIKASGQSTQVTMPVNYTASGEGGLLESMDAAHTSPSVTYPSTPGDVTTTVEVYSPIRKLWSAVATFKVTVTPAKTSSAEVTDDSSEYIEGAMVHYKVSLSDAPSGNVYAFLYNYEESPAGTFGGAGAKAIITDLNAIAPGSQGIQITSVGTEAKGSFMVLDGISEDDGGSTYTFGVVLCTSKTFNPANRVEGYTTTDLINITVYNKDPTFLQLYLNGFESDGDGYTFPNEYPKGQPQTIQPEFDDVSYDLDHGFIYKWTIKKDGKDVTNGIVRHDDASDAYDASSKTPVTIVPTGTRINTASFSYSFPNAGTYEVRVQMRDKDMSRWAAEDRKFYVTIIDQPQVQIRVEDMYLEMASRDAIHVGLGYFPDSGETVIVKLTVTPPAGDNAGVLVLDSAYKTVPAGYPALAANEYYVPFTAAGEQDILIEVKDGTMLSSSKGFTVTGEVMNDTESIEPGVPWKDYYRPYSVKAYVENEKPIFSSVTPENTNAWTVAGGAATSYPIRFTIKADVDADWSTEWTDEIDGATGTGIHVTFSGCDNAEAEGRFLSEPGSVKFIPNFGAVQGEQVVVVTVSDKDGGSQTWTYLYMVKPSKFLTTIPNGPTGFGNSELSKKYSRTALKGGRGEGHLYVPGATFSDGTAWRQRWNCSSAPSVDVYAWGYRVGAFDNGWLNNEMDLAITEGGVGTAKAATADVTAGFYPYPDAEKDSFLYAWLISTPQTESGPPEWTLTLAPEQPSAKAEPATAYLPTAMTDDEAYIPVYAEAVFSKEWYPEDNLGDINQDGIPDYFAIATWGNGMSLITTMTGAEPADADLNDLADGNPDEDYIPGVWQAQGKLSLVNKELASYAPIGYPLNNRLEIRGFHHGLNETSLTLSDPSFSDAEQAAYKAAFKEENNRDWTDADGFDLGFWSPEPRGVGEQYRMDPTMEDTDSDGMPDGWEYFFWYQAKVWAPAARNGAKGADLGKKRDGQLFVFERFNPDDIVRGLQIPDKEVLERFDPCVELDRTVKDFNPDFDHDGLTDLEELVIGTNPCHWDTDGDHMCDGWEVLHALDPLNGSKVGNPDGDFMAYVSLSRYWAVAATNTTINTYVFDLDLELREGRDYETTDIPMYAMKEYYDSHGFYIQTASPKDDNGDDNYPLYYYTDADGNDHYTTNSIAVDNIPTERYTTVGSITIRDVPLTAALIAPAKLDANNRPYLYGLDTDAPPVPIPPVWHWSYPMLDHKLLSAEDRLPLFRRGAYTIPADTLLIHTSHILIHDQVHAAFGFDPRTGWYKDSAGYVADRWNPAIRRIPRHALPPRFRHQVL